MDNQLRDEKGIDLHVNKNVFGKTLKKNTDFDLMTFEQQEVSMLSVSCCFNLAHIQFFLCVGFSTYSTRISTVISITDFCCAQFFFRNGINILFILNSLNSRALPLSRSILRRAKYLLLLSFGTKMVKIQSLSAQTISSFLIVKGSD